MSKDLLSNSPASVLAEHGVRSYTDHNDLTSQLNASHSRMKGLWEWMETNRLLAERARQAVIDANTQTIDTAVKHALRPVLHGIAAAA